MSLVIVNGNEYSKQNVYKLIMFFYISTEIGRTLPNTQWQYISVDNSKKFIRFSYAICAYDILMNSVNVHAARLKACLSVMLLLLLM